MHFLIRCAESVCLQHFPSAKRDRTLDLPEAVMLLQAWFFASLACAYGSARQVVCSLAFLFATLSFVLSHVGTSTTFLRHCASLAEVFHCTIIQDCCPEARE